MFPFLVSLAFSEKNFTIANPSNPDACFDIKYTNNGESNTMTHGGSGYFVGFRVRKDTSEGEVQLVKNSEGRKSIQDEVEVKFQHDFDPVTGYLRILFNITNNGYFSQKVDLGVYADSDFANNDANSVSLRTDNRGLTVSNEQKQLHYTVFLKDFGPLPNVNTTFIGEHSTGAAKTYPFFTNSAGESKPANSAYAFSWAEKEVMGGESIILGVTFAPDDKVPTPSRITDKTKKSNTYFKNAQRTFTFLIEDADVGETITVHMDFNGEKETEEFTVTENEKSKTITREKDLGPGPTFNYKVYATDSKHKWMSNFVEYTMPISIRPTLQAWKAPNSKIYYQENGPNVINFDFSVGDDKYVTVSWQFDNGRIETDNKVYQSYGNTVPVRFEAPIPPQITASEGAGKEHTVTIWATDNYGVKSNPRTHKFTYIIVPPLIQVESGLSSRVAIKGQSNIIGYTIVNSTVVGRKLSIHYKFKNNNIEVYERLTTTEVPQVTAYFINVPSYISSGTYDVEVTVVDDENGAYSNKELLTMIIQD